MGSICNVQLKCVILIEKYISEVLELFTHIHYTFAHL